MPSQTAVSPELEEFRRQVNWRDQKGFRYAKEIYKPYGTLDEVLKWCKAELTEDWRWQMVDMSSHQQPGRYIFYFDGERDYLAFCLKWG